MSNASAIAITKNDNSHISIIAPGTILQGDWITTRQVFQDTEHKITWVTFVKIDLMEHEKKEEAKKKKQEKQAARATNEIWQTCSCHWDQRIGKPSPDLDPTINGGCIRTALAARKGDSPMRVMAYDDVKQILDRRHAKANRRTVPGIPGEWIDDNLWNDQEYGLCVTDCALRDMAERDYDDPISAMAPVKWRRQKQERLGGKPLSHRRLPPLRFQVRGRRVPVSCWDEAKKILEQRKADREAAKAAKVPKGWLKTKKLYAAIKAKVKPKQQFDRHDLHFALPAFREAFPKDCGSFPIEGRGQTNWTNYYKPERVAAWASTVNIRELAEIQRRRQTPEIRAQHAERIAKVIRFLQFVLTRPAPIYEPKPKEPLKHKEAPRFSVRAFRTFLHHPPYGMVLTPLEDGVHNHDIKRWAKEARIPIHSDCGILIVAQLLKREGKLEQGPGKRNWRLLGPVFVEPIDLEVKSAPPKNGHESMPAAEKRGEGKTTSPDYGDLGLAARSADVIAAGVQAGIPVDVIARGVEEGIRRAFNGQPHPSLIDPSLHETDIAILKALRNSKEQSVSQVDLAIRAEVDRRTLADRLPALIEKEYVYKHGERKGISITPKGRAACPPVEATPH